MANPHMYISKLLERLPKWELSNYDHQITLDKIRDKIASTQDIQAELYSLYKVKGFGDFALSLMWIVDKVEKGITLEESTIDEETLVMEKYRAAMGDNAPGQPAAFGQSVLADFGSAPTEQPAASSNSFWGGTQEVPPPPFGNPTDSSDPAQEKEFAGLLERFLESVQSGNDDRMTLMNEVSSQCNSVAATEASPEDYRSFCRMLVDFLQYISDNQYLDDVRVMNIVSNIHDPFSQWARTDPAGRAGILDQANDILRDYKTMFE
jgi:hypothetical protein